MAVFNDLSVSCRFKRPYIFCVEKTVILVNSVLEYVNEKTMFYTVVVVFIILET